MEKENFWIKNKKYLIFSALCLIVLVAGILIGFFFLPPSSKESQPKEDPATETFTGEVETKETETDENSTEEKSAFPDVPLMKGIDVSKWQGNPDWNQVKAADVEFAMIRLGYRSSDGAFGEDPKAYSNLKGADEAGILTGVYFFSGAQSPEDAVSEARWVLERVGEYSISFPIVMDYEMMGNDSALSATERTDTAIAFLQTVKAAGYTAMLYVPIEEFEDALIWEKERILDEFYVWGARYDAPSYPEITSPQENNVYAMWQYSNTGKVNGISGNVDLDLAYFTAERKEPKKEVLSEEGENEFVKEFNQTFTPSSRRVTAKIEVNLRRIPSIDGELVGSLKKGEYLLCTGDSDMGWSRLEYEGENVYAVTSYLVDENGQSIVPKQSFRAASDKVTAKIEVNLRREASNEAEIVGVLKNGVFLTRTGIGDKGWSRLEYEGQTVYAVTSYLQAG